MTTAEEFDDIPPPDEPMDSEPDDEHGWTPRVVPDPEPIEPADDYDGLTPEHAAYLAENAIDPDFAVSVGIRSIIEAGALPKCFAYLGKAGVPAIYFPFTDPDGVDEPQLKVMDGSKGYKFRSKKHHPDYQAPFWAIRQGEDDGPVLIVEGSKQCVVAAQYAPAQYSVFGISGCWGWSTNRQPTPHFELVADRHVVVMFDADRTTKASVWDAAAALEKALLVEGAASVKFADIPGDGGTGLDDLLASRKPERRGIYLARLLAQAEKRKKTGRPKESAKQQKAERAASGEDSAQAPDVGTADRPMLDVSKDRWLVINEMTDRLVDRWNTTRLFNYGKALTQLQEDGTLDPLVRETFADLVQESLTTIVPLEFGVAYTWPDATSMSTALARASRFAKLDKLSRVPFIRPDGTVCQHPGYDADTSTFLFLTPELEGIDVPDEPSADQVAAAVKLLLDDWLGDMPFHTTADRANGLALVLTPFVRGMVPLVPLAVIDGLQMGVGKNLLADVVSILITGKVEAPLPYTTDQEETRKVITSTFRTGAELFVFDEAHVIEGTQLARAITSITYRDRILGVSNMVEFPNNVTWMSLGNNVQVNGDLIRRVYRVALHPDVDNPHDRPASSFRHADLKGWTRENRARLIRACLVLIRAWFAAGQPQFPRSTGLGSFEQWEKVVAGVLGNAGVADFLGNIQQWRSDSDFNTAAWRAHLAWLHETFGPTGGLFTTKQVKQKIVGAGVEVAPPRLTDFTATDFTVELGKAYFSVSGQRRFDGYVLTRDGGAHGKVAKWRIDGPAAPDPDPDGGVEGSEGSPAPSREPKKTHVPTRDDADVCVFAGAEAPGDPSAPLPPLTPAENGPTHPAIARLLGGVTVDVPTCALCDGPKATVPPANLMWLCPSCHPASFRR